MRKIGIHLYNVIIVPFQSILKTCNISRTKTHFSWTLLLVLIVLPIAAIGLLHWCYRKRGGVDTSWGGALMVSLCLLVGLVVILGKVWT